MSEVLLRQSTDFKIVTLTITIDNGQKFDLKDVFQEINLYDNLFLPCMSANMYITDSQNLIDKLKFQGNEKVMIEIHKNDDFDDQYNYKNEFVVYKISDRTNLTPTSQVYCLNLVREDFILSLQKKINQHYKSTYSDMVDKILQDYLKVSDDLGSNDGKSKFQMSVPTLGLQDIIIPNLTPFETIEFITKRALSLNKNPDYVFYESPISYNFIPLSNIARSIPRANINLKPKNVDDDVGSEFFGARSYKVISSFNTIETVKEGSYTGKFVGFDTVTRTQKIQRITDAFSQVKDHANKQSNLKDFKNKENKSSYDMVDSRVVSYPFTFTRTQLDYIKKNNPAMTTYLDNTDQYVFQRKAIFTNLLQKRLQITLPGNFSLFSGETVGVFVPKFGIKDNDNDATEAFDKSLTGKYIIIGTRHVISYNKHETLIEVASDSNIK